MQEEMKDNQQSAEVVKVATLRSSLQETLLAIPKSVVELQRRLFHLHPSAVVARMIFETAT